METRHRSSKKAGIKNESSEIAEPQDIKKSPSRVSKSKLKDDEVPTTSSAATAADSKPPIYGPMPTFSKQRVWSRTVLILGVLTVIYFNTNTTTKESAFAKFEEKYPGRAFETKCSPSYDENISTFFDCRPRKCGRLITDDILLPSELILLSDLAKRTLEFDPKLRSVFAVYDLMSGKLATQDYTIDLIQANSSATRPIFKHGDLTQFQILEAKLKRVIGDHFKLPNFAQAIFLAKPSFFARLAGQGKGSDSYTHVKVDQTNYNSFHYSAIVFLSDYGKDFEGGRFIFPDGDFTNRTVEARKGRVLIYTSGLENKNYIEKVTKGSQIILTIGFTCDLANSIKRPKLN